MMANARKQTMPMAGWVAAGEGDGAGFFEEEEETAGDVGQDDEGDGKEDERGGAEEC